MQGETASIVEFQLLLYFTFQGKKGLVESYADSVEAVGWFYAYDYLVAHCLKIIDEQYKKIIIY